MRLFVTLDGVSGKIGGESSIGSFASLIPVGIQVASQESTEGKAVNLHVCLTEKAFKFDAEMEVTTGLHAWRNRGFARYRTGGKPLADVTEALLRHGRGLELGPDSDGLLNCNMGYGGSAGGKVTFQPDPDALLDDSLGGHGGRQLAYESAQDPRFH